MIELGPPPLDIQLRLDPESKKMASYLWGAPVDIEIRLDAEEARKQFEVKLEKDRKESLAVYLDGESVVGQVCGL